MFFAYNLTMTIKSTNWNVVEKDRRKKKSSKVEKSKVNRDFLRSIFLGQFLNDSKWQLIHSFTAIIKVQVMNYKSLLFQISPSNN